MRKVVYDWCLSCDLRALSTGGVLRSVVTNDVRGVQISASFQGTTTNTRITYKSKTL